jgi:O-succinylbenzoic acid--CoA ligase
MERLDMLMAPTWLAAERDPAGLALSFDGLDWSHGELEARVVDAARRLATWGVGPSTVVGLWGLNSAHWVVALHALGRLGAIALPLSTRWTDAELADGLQRAEASCLLADDALMVRAKELCARVMPLAGLANAPLSTRAPSSVSAPSASGPISTQASSAASALLPRVPVAPLALPALAHARPGNEPLVRLLTSGSSGRPKVVELSRGAMLASAHAVSGALALGPTDRWWVAMPLFHVGGLGMLLRAPLAGAALLLASRFDAEDLRNPGLGATVASFVPTMLAAVLERGPLPESLRVAMLGGAPVPPALIARCPIALATYGLTEAASTVTLAPLDADPLARAGSGHPLPGMRLRVLTQTGELAATSEVGRLQVAGPSLMTRYVGDETATANALVDGWLETGDFAHLDAAGRLFVAGRREDLIVSGGENVYPAEVEAALLEHPSLAAVAVVGVSHPRWGHAPLAFVVPRDGARLEPETLGRYLDGKLARFKQPCAYAILGALPLLANGKPDRLALRQKAEQREAGVE